LIHHGICTVRRICRQPDHRKPPVESHAVSVIEPSLLRTTVSTARPTNLPCARLLTARIRAVTVITEMGAAHIEKRAAPATSKLKEDVKHALHPKVLDNALRLGEAITTQLREEPHARAGA